MLKRFIAIIFLLLPLFASAEDFVAGKNYELINGATGADSKNQKISIMEFFSYACPWCYRIEPTLIDWIKKQGNSIQFSRVPVVFHKDWTYYAKAYYTTHLLNLDTKLDLLLFKTIQDKNHPMNSNEAMIAFFTAQGVDPATVKSAFENSTTVDMQVNQGTALMAQYHVTGVPAFVINNQYKTDLQMANGDITTLIKILDFLVAKVKEGNKSTT